MGRRSFLGELCSVPDHLGPHSVAVDLTDNLGPHVVAVGMPPLPRLVPDRATPAACHSAQRVRRPGEPADSSAGSNVDITASPEGSGLGDTWANMIGKWHRDCKRRSARDDRAALWWHGRLGRIGSCMVFIYL